MENVTYSAYVRAANSILQYKLVEDEPEYRDECTAYVQSRLDNGHFKQMDSLVFNNGYEDGARLFLRWLKIYGKYLEL